MDACSVLLNRILFRASLGIYIKLCRLILGYEPSNGINSLVVDITVVQCSVVGVYKEVVTVLWLDWETFQVVRQQSWGRPVRLLRGQDDHQESWVGQVDWGNYELCKIF